MSVLSRYVAVLAAATAASALQAQQPERATFFLIGANDTISIERYTRTAERVTGELLLKQQGSLMRYSLTLTPDAGVSRTELTVYRAASDTTPLARATLTLHGDTMLVNATPPGAEQRLATSGGAITYFNPSAVVLEQALMRAKRTGAASIPLFQSVGGTTVPLTVTWAGSDSALLALGGVEFRAAVGSDGRLLGAVIPSQRVRVVRAGATAAPVIEKPDYSAPAGAPYTAEEVRVRTPAGFTLAGTLTMPAVHPKRGAPAVVMITGSGPEERDESIPGVRGYRPFRQIADTLSRRGIAVLRLDDRGVGGSEMGPPDPSSADFANDIRAGLAWLRTRPDVDGHRLGLIGHSEGGMIAPMIAATDPALEAIVLLAGPAETGRQILAYQQRYAMERMSNVAPEKRDSLLAAARTGLDSMAAKNAWIRFFLDYDPQATARRVKTPVLILQGETDRQVTAEQAQTLAAAFRAGGNHDVTVRVFPSTDHLFLADPVGNPSGYAALPSKNISPDVLGTMADWLSAHLR